MKPEDLHQKLFVAESEKYGDKYIEHLLEQYKLYVESAERISDRRQKSNEFFLGLNSALVALLGFVATKAITSDVTLILAASSLAGATVCYFWYRIIRSYKGLNSGKFEVIHAVEARLPLALYDTEWEALRRGSDKAVYWPFTHIELSIPWIFVGIYALLTAFALPWQELAKAACAVAQ